MPCARLDPDPSGLGHTCRGPRAALALAASLTRKQFRRRRGDSSTWPRPVAGTRGRGPRRRIRENPGTRARNLAPAGPPQVSPSLFCPGGREALSWPLAPHPLFRNRHHKKGKKKSSAFRAGNSLASRSTSAPREAVPKEQHPEPERGRDPEACLQGPAAPPPCTPTCPDVIAPARPAPAPRGPPIDSGAPASLVPPIGFRV